jgi:hypothetical protein
MNIDGANIDSSPIGANTASTAAFTSLSATLASTITTADNTDTLSLISTDADANVAPNLRMYRNSGSPADSDQLGKIQLEGRNDNSQDVIYAEIGSQIKDASDGTEDGRIFINSMVAGTLQSRINVLDTETVFNDESIDLDFRVESNGNANMLFVDGGNDRVGIGTDSPAELLEIQGTEAAGSIELLLTNVGDGGLSTTPYTAIRSKLNSVRNGGEIRFGRDSNYGSAANADSNMQFYTALNDTNTEKMRITSDGHVGIGTASPQKSLHLSATSPVIRLEDSDGGYAEVSGSGGNLILRADEGASESSSHIRFEIDDSAQMRLTTTGLGIGNTLGSFHSSVLPLIVGSGSGDEGMAIYSGSSSKGKIGFADAATDDSGSYRGYFQYDHSGDNLNIGTAGLERARITSDGKVFIGDSTFGGTAAVHAVEVPASGAGCLIRVDSAANASETMLQFQDAASQALGSITSNPSANTTAYNTSSDGRLKDITGEAKGLEIINALNPVAFTWKSSGVKAEGLIAQEVEKLVDHAVSETKESEYLQMDYSKLVTPLIKAVQELSAEVEQLKQQAHEKCEN